MSKLVYFAIPITVATFFIVEYVAYGGVVGLQNGLHFIETNLPLFLLLDFAVFIAIWLNATNFRVVKGKSRYARRH